MAQYKTRKTIAQLSQKRADIGIHCPKPAPKELREATHHLETNLVVSRTLARVKTPADSLAHQGIQRRMSSRQLQQLVEVL